ncbi:clostripain-related cysteine peptidase [Methanospirillum sp.]|uniref:clostripain-related cysteine peptidase n=1 Tax=Methanospirillum sp. TaxID=45200 RepID=UPI00359F3B5B
MRGKAGNLLVFLIFSIVLFAPVQAVADENSTLLIAFYASGGSLEQEMGLITNDFAQVVRGAENLSERVTIFAAYGGADKPGWKGMTIASLDELKEDLSDGELGNSNVSVQKIQNANMGDPESLSFFLSYINKKYQYDRLFLIFIGHGQAYTGMLFDQNHGDDGLTIGELTKGLELQDIDLIGFDSCMMGCLEVLSALAPFASYLIASEETEPKDGWPYDPWIAYIGAHPDEPVEQYAKILFDEYMKNPNSGKTIALLNPKKADYLTEQLDLFAKDLYALAGDPKGCEIIRQILSQTQQFGLTGNGNLEEVTMDLYSFAKQTGLFVPYLSDSAEELIEGINQTVIFARHDAMVPGANGVSILSPVMINPVFYEYYRESAFITPSWDRFLVRYLGECSKESGNLIPSFE